MMFTSPCLLRRLNVGGLYELRSTSVHWSHIGGAIISVNM